MLTKPSNIFYNICLSSNLTFFKLNPKLLNLSSDTLVKPTNDIKFSRYNESDVSKAIWPK